MLSSFCDLLDEGDLIGGIVDDEVARQADLRRLAPQQPRAERVKGREPDAFGLLADQRFHPLAHLAGGLVGEGHRQHLIRLGMAIADEVGDPIRDDARLTGPGAGEDEQRPVDTEHGLTLFGIELAEEVHCWGSC